jgi:uncharacterized membrane-anchored protein
MQKRLFAVLCCLALGGAGAAPADGPGAHRKAAGDRLAVLFTPHKGRIALPGDIASLDLPANFRYLDPADTAHMLEAWGNPPGAASLGMIVPAGVNPMSPDSWGIVITYDKAGHGPNDTIRVPGRDGVLALNAVAGVGQLAQARSGMRQVPSFTSFTAGKRDADADGGSGKMAGYGIAALVAGGVAATLFRRTPKADAEQASEQASE